MKMLNDINIRTTTAWKYGVGKGCSHMVFLSLYPKLKAGLILNGSLYESNARLIEVGENKEFWERNYGRKEKIKECGEYLGKKLALLIQIINPEKIIIESMGKEDDELLLQYAKVTAQKECMDISFDVCQIILDPVEK